MSLAFYKHVRFSLIGLKTSAPVDRPQIYPYRPQVYLDQMGTADVLDVVYVNIVT
jgi:hypothetical protein